MTVGRPLGIGVSTRLARKRYARRETPRGIGSASTGLADGMTAHKRLLCSGGIMLVVLLWAAVSARIPSVIGSDSKGGGRGLVWRLSAS